MLEGFFVSVIEVPDGEEPFSWYGKWKKRRWFKKVNPVTLLAVGFGLGSAFIAIVLHLTQGG